MDNEEQFWADMAAEQYADEMAYYEQVAAEQDQADYEDWLAERLADGHTEEASTREAYWDEAVARAEQDAEDQEWSRGCGR